MDSPQFYPWNQMALALIGLILVVLSRAAIILALFGRDSLGERAGAGEGIAHRVGVVALTVLTWYLPLFGISIY